MEVVYDGIWVSVRRNTVSLVPWNVGTLRANTGMGAEVLRKGNFDRHKGYRGRAGLAGRLLLHKWGLRLQMLLL